MSSWLLVGGLLLVGIVLYARIVLYVAGLLERRRRELELAEYLDFSRLLVDLDVERELRRKTSPEGRTPSPVRPSPQKTERAQ